MGLLAGDIILNLNGTNIHDVATFKRIASSQVRGWQITLQRQGQLIRTYIDG
jgi:S1-C subfamily serine protease